MRMRTIEAAYAELLAADPGCGLAKSALRRMVVSGRIPSVKVGNKYLLDLDKLPEYLFPPEPETPEPVPAGIRRQEARIQKKMPV